MHGQNDQLRLLRSGEQRAVLDRFGGEPVQRVLREYQRVRAEWVEVARELDERTERSRELAREADLLQHGLSEIDAETQVRMRIEMRTLVERASRWLINNRRPPIDSAATVTSPLPTRTNGCSLSCEVAARYTGRSLSNCGSASRLTIRWVHAVAGCEDRSP